MGVRVTTTGSERLAARARGISDALKVGVLREAEYRGDLDLKEQNASMGRQAPNDADTVRMKGGAAVLESSGKAKRVGKVVAKINSLGVASYVIRRPGTYSGESKIAAQQGRHLRQAQTKAAIKAGRSLRYVQSKRGGVRRVISVEKVLAIARAGVAGRQPARDYTDHGQAWRERASRDAMRRYLGAVLQSRGFGSMTARFARDIVEIVSAAGGV